MLTMVEYVHQRISTYSFQVGVDFTMGNGHDTLFLAEQCPKVYAFDIQPEALENTKKPLGDRQHVQLILDSHENMKQYFSSFDIGIFNLGYLPQASHHITTTLPSTQKAVCQAIEMMKKALFIVVYPGHEEGYQESLWIHEYVSQLDSHQFHVSCFQMLNKKKAPYVIEIEKKQ